MLSTDHFVTLLAFGTLGIVAIYGIMQYVAARRTRDQREATPLTRRSEQERANEGSIIRK